jgi:hypothetical protein
MRNFYGKYYLGQKEELWQVDLYQKVIIKEI